MMKKLILTSLVLTLTGTGKLPAEPKAGPGLAVAVSPEEIRDWEISVMPDGRGLPPGQGDASQGKGVYAASCQSCHGPNGQGGSADRLAFAQMGLTDKWPEKTIGNYWPYATTLFDFNRRAMPMDNPGSLSNDEAYAVTAYLLYLNGIITETEVMNAATLAAVEMPNRDGFIDMYPVRLNSTTGRTD